MQEFSASKACAGFESISQYANNLFTKPWRREYKTIKVSREVCKMSRGRREDHTFNALLFSLFQMYSGFFQHEVKSNLLDAEQLFEAMGYKIMSKDLLVLDEAICPDQVTNVSRDAMAAYVECQIIKEIFSGLTERKLSCSLVDIFKFREVTTGTASQVIKMMSCNILDEIGRNAFYNGKKKVLV